MQSNSYIPVVVADREHQQQSYHNPADGAHQLQAMQARQMLQVIQGQHDSTVMHMTQLMQQLGMAPPPHAGGTSLPPMGLKSEGKHALGAIQQEQGPCAGNATCLPSSITASLNGGSSCCTLQQESTQQQHSDGTTAALCHQHVPKAAAPAPAAAAASGCCPQQQESKPARPTDQSILAALSRQHIVMQLQTATQHVHDLHLQAQAAAKARGVLAAELECSNTERDMLMYDLKSVTQRLEFLEPEVAQMQQQAALMTNRERMLQEDTLTAKTSSFEAKQRQHHQQQHQEALVVELQLLLGARQEQAELHAILAVVDLSDIRLRDQLAMARMHEASLRLEAEDEQARCAALQRQLYDEAHGLKEAEGSFLGPRRVKLADLLSLLEGANDEAAQLQEMLALRVQEAAAAQPTA
jgi:hypothetical protein